MTSLITNTDDESSLETGAYDNIEPGHMLLNDKYDALFQQFKTIKLEKELYETEMKKLQKENAILKHQNDCVRRESDKSEQITPLLSKSLQQMASALDDVDDDRERLIDESLEYRELVHTLKEENQTLKEQITQYQQTVETLKNEQYNKDSEHKHTTDELKKEIQDIQYEESHIYEKYEEKTSQFDALKVQHKAELTAQTERSLTSVKSDKSLHLKFAKTDNPNAAHLSPYSSAYLNLSRYQSDDKLELVQYTSAEYTSAESSDALSDGNPMINVQFAIDDEKGNNTAAMKEKDNEIVEYKKKCKQNDLTIARLNKKVEQMNSKQPKGKTCYWWFD